MRKLLLGLFLSTAGLLFAGHASAQKEIAPGIIKLQAGEIDNSNISFASATWCFPDMAQFPSGIDSII